MMPRNAQHMFNVAFTKPAAEVKERVHTKVIQLKAKIKERQERVKTLRKEHGITDAALIDLLTQARKAMRDNEARMSYSYSVSNAAVGGGHAGGGGMHDEVRTIGAGVVNHLLTENDFIEAERDEVKRLELFARNVQDTPNWEARRLPGESVPMVGVHLSYDELEYLGY